MVGDEEFTITFEGGSYRKAPRVIRTPVPRPRALATDELVIIKMMQLGIRLLVSFLVGYLLMLLIVFLRG
jgi:hypothetical protein